MKLETFEEIRIHRRKHNKSHVKFIKDNKKDARLSQVSNFRDKILQATRINWEFRRKFPVFDKKLDVHYGRFKDMTNDKYSIRDKDRITKNGVKFPIAGSIKSDIWVICDRLKEHRGDGGIPLLRDVVANCEHRGFNQNTAHRAYFEWKKFHGLVGPVEPPVVLIEDV